MSKTATDDQQHKLRLSIDLQSCKDMQFAMNLICSYQIKLSQVSVRTFTQDKATAVPQGARETKLEAGFASYEFNVSKNQLLQLLALNSNVEIAMKDRGVHSASAFFDMKSILEAPLKKSPTSMVRVCD